MVALITGIFIGFLMCIPIGPINVWVINTHVRKGMIRALAIALGGSLMDLVYFFIILSGLSLLTFSDVTAFYLKIGGTILVFGLGIRELFYRSEGIKDEDENNSVKNILGAFLFGIILYISNPTLIMTMTGLGTMVKSFAFFHISFANNLLVSLGLALGSFGWFVFLVVIINRYKEKIRSKYLKYFTKVSGILMIMLSVFMAWRVYLEGNK